VRGMRDRPKVPLIDGINQESAELARGLEVGSVAVAQGVVLGPRMTGRRTTRGGGSLKVRTREHGASCRRNHLGDYPGCVSHISGGDKTRGDVEGVRSPRRVTDKGAKKSKRLVLLELRGCFVSSVHVPLHEVNPRIAMKSRSDPVEVS
jgi:hypothetical protein